MSPAHTLFIDGEIQHGNSVQNDTSEWIRMNNDFNELDKTVKRMERK